MSVYLLNHSELPAEIVRLEWQHRNLLVPLMGGQLLPAAVDAHLRSQRSPPPAVADVATGTGVWLVDLAAALPADARLDGFDVDVTKFRPAAALPGNVRLQHDDALRPPAPAVPPAAQRGRYDVVHVRLLMLALRPADWAPLAARLLAMLRPGGYLVWEEIDPASFAGRPAGSVVADTVDLMVRFHRQQQGAGEVEQSPCPYPLGLDALLRSAGFVDAAQQAYRAADRAASDPALFAHAQRAAAAIAASYLQGMVDAGGFEAVQTRDDAARRAAAVQQALAAGAATSDFCLWRTVGRKPV